MREQLGDAEEKPKDKSFDVVDIDVGFSNEIGFSNDLHSENTMLFLTLSKDIPMIMSEITSLLRGNQVGMLVHTWCLVHGLL